MSLSCPLKQQPIFFSDKTISSSPRNPKVHEATTRDCHHAFLNAWSRDSQCVPTQYGAVNNNNNNVLKLVTLNTVKDTFGKRTGCTESFQTVVAKVTVDTKRAWCNGATASARHHVDALNAAMLLRSWLSFRVLARCWTRPVVQDFHIPHYPTTLQSSIDLVARRTGDKIRGSSLAKTDICR